MKKNNISGMKIILLVMLLESILLSCDPLDGGTTDGTSGATARSSSVINQKNNFALWIKIN